MQAHLAVAISSHVVGLRIPCAQAELACIAGGLEQLLPLRLLRLHYQHRHRRHPVQMPRA